MSSTVMPICRNLSTNRISAFSKLPQSSAWSTVLSFTRNQAPKGKRSGTGTFGNQRRKRCATEEYFSRAGFEANLCMRRENANALPDFLVHGSLVSRGSGDGMNHGEETGTG